ncbi:hypothetical protein VJI77_07600, partial [Parvimonas sp. D2]|uniref:hypothetical protein n=1 Tax=Parvimonas sp. D2 TaxID=3110691 RepID=UPI002B49AFC2
HLNNVFGHISKTGEAEKPSKKKPIFPVNDELRSYLTWYSREVKLPVSYRDLQRYNYSVALKDRQGNDTSWEKVSYDMHEWNFLREN